MFKKNMFLDYGYNSSSAEKMKLIKKYGFDGIFLHANSSFEENVKLASEYGLKIETIHLPFHNVCNNVWLDDPSGEEYTELIIEWINKASNNNIDKVIFHLSQSNTPPQMNELGFARIKRMLDVAKAKNVYIAFENLRNLEYLEATMDRFGPSDHAICCFDVGHASCFSKNIDTYDFPRYAGLIRCLLVQKCDVLAPGLPHTPVAGLADTGVLLFMEHADAVVLRRIPVADGGRGISAPIVNQQKFPVGKRLPQYALNTLTQILLRLIYRHNNRNTGHSGTPFKDTGNR